MNAHVGSFVCKIELDSLTLGAFAHWFELDGYFISDGERRLFLILVYVTLSLF